MKDIMLKITGRLVSSIPAPPDASDSVIEFTTPGKFSTRGGITRITYEETELSGFEGCRTYLTITGDKLKMQRKGKTLAEDSIMEFEKGRRYEGSYETPYGSVAMEILTNEIDVRNPEKISIDYSLALKGLMESRNTLDIEVLN